MLLFLDDANNIVKVKSIEDYPLSNNIPRLSYINNI